ncbi:MAG: FAD-binding protein, partial [Candidatus Methanosuratus sp.]|nr:FAD-binding protein [Candidatus Methanosuratincola sp.]
MSSAEKKGKKVSRKEFVKGTAVGAAGVAAAGVLAGCAPAATPTPQVIKETVEVPVEVTREVIKEVEVTKEVVKEVEVKPWLPQKWDYEADVVVVGYGLAGATAGYEAKKAGADVLILEKAPEEWKGGNSKIGGSVIWS